MPDHKTSPEVSQQMEGKQEKFKRKLFLIYRDNSFFREIVPDIVSVLASLNYQIIENKFDEGTSEGEISAWEQGHAQELRGQELVTDETFNRSIGQVEIGNLKNWESKLDSIVEHATFRTLFGTGLKPIGTSRMKGERINMIEEMENCRLLMMSMIRRILSNPENIPNKVVIFQNHLTDHRPFSTYNYANTEKKTAAAQILKGWLIESGVPEEIISIFESRAAGFKNDIFDCSDLPGVSKKSWIIYDRHYSVHAGLGKGLVMPLGEFFYYAFKAGLLKYKPQEIKDAIEEAVLSLCGENE